MCIRDRFSTMYTHCRFLCSIFKCQVCWIRHEVCFLSLACQIFFLFTQSTFVTAWSRFSECSHSGFSTQGLFRLEASLREKLPSSCDKCVCILMCVCFLSLFWLFFVWWFEWWDVGWYLEFLSAGNHVWFFLSVVNDIRHDIDMEEIFRSKKLVPR